MKQIVSHLLIPALAPAVFFAIAATPVEVLGCRNRGLLALAVVFISLLGAAGATVVGTRRKGEPDGRWWAVSALILTLPAVALIFLA